MPPEDVGDRSIFPRPSKPSAIRSTSVMTSARVGCRSISIQPLSTSTGSLMNSLFLPNARLENPNAQSRFRLTASRIFMWNAQRLPSLTGLSYRLLERAADGPSAPSAAQTNMSAIAGSGGPDNFAAHRPLRSRIRLSDRPTCRPRHRVCATLTGLGRVD
jgi:hypothetical protein